MGLRFRHSFQLFPGVRLNLSCGSISATFGVPGASVNVGPRGVRSTVGVPGSGLSYTHHHGHGGGRPRSNISPQPQPDQSAFQPSAGGYGGQIYIPPQFQMREINSASVEDLTSHSLIELRDMIAQARSQRAEIQTDLQEAKQLFTKQSLELDRRRASWFRFMMKKKIAALEEAVPETEAEVNRLTGWMETTHIDINFDTGDEAKRAYASLVRAFDKLRTSAKIWDITSDRYGDRVAERSAASRTIERTPVALDFVASDLVRFDGRAMRFGNVNGEAILIYPGVVIMPRADGAFALIDLREIDLEFHAVNFVETDPVPGDSQIVGQTWAKVNKDGSPDRRFNNNYQIPITAYGRFAISSPGGVREEYQFSNLQAAGDFARAFEAFRTTLR